MRLAATHSGAPTRVPLRVAVGTIVVEICRRLECEQMDFATAACDNRLDDMTGALPRSQAMRCRAILVASVLLLPGIAWTKPVPADRTRELLEKHWGMAIDPDGDCTFRPERSRLCIVVPAKAHILSAEIGKTNAPCVLREVNGDFQAEVTVSGPFPADTRCLVEGRWPYHGAGLLLWQDEKNYVRFERAHMHFPNGQWRCYPGFELRKDGKMARSWQQTDGVLDETKPAVLRLVRKGGTVTASFSQDGKTWTELPPLQVDLDAKLRLGVHAVQNTPTAYEAILEHLTVVAESR
jgi:regulation of enolase protein 1 (concanavalin A-like superfamily)